MTRVGALPLAAAEVIGVPPARHSRARQAAAAAAHQRTQQIAVRRVVAGSKGMVRRQLGLHLLELRLTHHGRNLRYQDPALGGLRHRRAAGMPDRVGRRAAMRRCAGPHALRIDLPGVGRIAQDATNRGARPPRRARGRGNAARVQTGGELHQRNPRLSVHGEQLGHDGRLRRIERDTPWVTRSIRAQPIGVGRAGPGQQRPGTQLGQPAAAHPLGDQRALVLGHRAADLQQQMVMWVVAHRALQELRGTASPRPFLQQHHLDFLPAVKGLMDSRERGCLAG
jgi:hypothetical protein